MPLLQAPDQKDVSTWYFDDSQEAEPNLAEYQEKVLAELDADRWNDFQAYQAGDADEAQIRRLAQYQEFAKKNNYTPFQRADGEFVRRNMSEMFNALKGKDNVTNDGLFPDMPMGARELQGELFDTDIIKGMVLDSLTDEQIELNKPLIQRQLFDGLKQSYPFALGGMTAKGYEGKEGLLLRQALNKITVYNETLSKAFQQAEQSVSDNIKQYLKGEIGYLEARRKASRSIMDNESVPLQERRRLKDRFLRELENDREFLNERRGVIEEVAFNLKSLLIEDTRTLDEVYRDRFAGKREAPDDYFTAENNIVDAIYTLPESEQKKIFALALEMVGDDSEMDMDDFRISMRKKITTPLSKFGQGVKRAFVEDEKEMNLRAKTQDLLNEQIAKEGTWWQKSLLGAGDIGGYVAMGLATGPLSPGAVLVSIKEQTFIDGLRSGMTTSQANNYSTLSAPLQAAIEVVQNKLVLGKIPVVNKGINALSKKMATTLGGRIASTAGIFAASSAAQVTAETSQQLVDDLAFNTIEAFTENPEFREITKGRYREIIEENFIYTLIPALIGGGGVAVKSYMSQEYYAKHSDDKFLKEEYQLSDEELSKFDGVKDIDERINVLKDVLTPEKVRQIGRYHVTKSELEQKLVEFQAEGYDIQVQKENDVTKITIDGEEFVITDDVDATDAAYELKERMGNTAAMGSFRTLFNQKLVSEFFETGELKIEGQSFAGKADASSLQEMVDAGLVSPEAANARLESAILDGTLKSGTTLDQAIVLASNETFRDSEGMLQDVVTYMETADMLALFEDRGEGVLKHMVDKGVVRFDQMESWVRAYEEQTGTKLLPENYDATSQVAQGQLTEAMSKLMLAHLVGQRKRLVEPERGKNILNPAPNFAPKGFDFFLSSIASRYENVFRMAARLKKMERDGVSNSELMKALETMVGLDSDQRLRRREQEAEQEAEQVFREELENQGVNLREDIDAGPTMAVQPKYDVADAIDDISSGNTKTPFSSLNKVIDEAQELRKRQREESARRLRPRKRGKAAILDRITRARAAGEINEKTAQQLTQFVNSIKNDAIGDTAISIRKTGKISNFDFADSLVTFFLSQDKEGSGSAVSIHEFWHGLSRFLPEEEVSKFKQQYEKQLKTYLKKNPWFYAFVGRKSLSPRQFEEYRKFAPEEAQTKLTPVKDNSGNIVRYDILFDKENYRYSELDEFVAETMTDLVLQKQEMPDSFIGQMAKVIKEFLDLIKAKIGIDPYERFYQSVTNPLFGLEKIRESSIAPPSPLYEPINYSSQSFGVEQDSVLESRRILVEDAREDIDAGPTMAVTARQTLEDSLSKLEAQGPKIRAKGAAAAKKALRRILDEELKDYSFEKGARLDGGERMTRMISKVRAIAKLLPKDAITQRTINTLMSNKLLSLKTLTPKTTSEEARFQSLNETVTANRLTKLVKQLDSQLEKYIKLESEKRIVKLIGQAKTKRDSSGNLRPKVDIEYAEQINRIEEVISMSEDQFDAANNDIAAKIDKFALGGDEYQKMSDEGVTMDSLMLEAEILRLFGNLKEASSVDADAAAAFINDLIKEGRNSLKEKIETRKKQHEAERQRFYETQGLKEAPTKNDAQNMRTEMARARKRDSLLKIGRNMVRSLFTFDKTTQRLFNVEFKSLIPDEIAVKVASAGRINDMKSYRRRKRMMDFLNSQAKNNRGDELVEKWEKSVKEFKTKEQVSREDIKRKRKLKELPDQIQDIEYDEMVVLLLAADEKTVSVNGEKVSVGEILANMLDGTATKEQVAALKTNKRGVVNYEYIGERAEKGVIKENVLQLIHRVMLAEQPQYREAMELQGVDDAVLNEMRSFIEKQGATQFMEFLHNEFDSSYDEVAGVFERLYFTKLPKVERYVPAGASGLTDYSGVVGTGAPATGSLRPGSTKARVRKVSRVPDIHNILDLYMRHYGEMDYWTTHAEIVYELQQTLGDESVLTAVGMRSGGEYAVILREYVNEMMAQGEKTAIGLDAVNKVVRKTMEGRSIMGLAYNFQTVLVNLDAAMRSGYAINTKDYIKHFVKVFGNPKLIGEVFNSEIIQSRLLEGATPELRQMIQKAKKTGVWDKFIQFGYVPMQYADAFATSFSSAVAWSYFTEQGKAKGLKGKQLTDFVEDQTDVVIQRFSQPTRRSSLSLSEQQAEGFSKMIFQFKSDIRQGFEIEAQALRVLAGKEKTYGKDTAVKIILLNRVLRPAIYWAITSFYSSVFRDDDEPFSVEKLAYYMFLGPWGAMPIIGDVAVGLFSVMFDQKVWNTPVTDITKAVVFGASEVADIVNVFKNEEQSEESVLNRLSDKLGLEDDPSQAAKQTARAIGVLGGRPAGLYPIIRMIIDAQTGTNTVLQELGQPGIYYTDAEKFLELKSEVDSYMKEAKEKDPELSSKNDQNKYRKEKAKAFKTIWSKLEEDEKEAFLDKMNAPSYIRKETKKWQ